MFMETILASPALVISSSGTYSFPTMPIHLPLCVMFQMLNQYLDHIVNLIAQRSHHD